MGVMRREVMVMVRIKRPGWKRIDLVKNSKLKAEIIPRKNEY